MLFAIHPPTLELQLALLRVSQRHGERCCEWWAHACGERVAGLLREGVISLQCPRIEDLPTEALDSASRQTDDLLGDHHRLGELAWRLQLDTWRDCQQALAAWQQATYGPH